MGPSSPPGSDPQLELLGKEHTTATRRSFSEAPVVTGDALSLLTPRAFPQRALYGRIISQQVTGYVAQPQHPGLFLNTNAPFSALVCGVQGSGKSHSTSVLLESCLMADARLGTLPAPLTALMFHYDTAAGGGLVQPCEAAYIACLDAVRGGSAQAPVVNVLVLPSNLETMKRVYAGLPGVQVKAMHFTSADISAQRLLSIMKVDGTGMPLYMEAIMSMLRSTTAFDYAQFREHLELLQFDSQQRSMLNIRLSLLDECLRGGKTTNSISSHFKKGQLTIVDLSSPFVDSASACGFFDLILGLFVDCGPDGSMGKLVVLDEAHKYLSDSQTGTVGRLTESLLTVIRQQRHLATRVIVSTQEPTVVPTKFVDLCSFVLAHRFSSPSWVALFAKHTAAAKERMDDIFSQVVALRTGEALLFAPNGVGVRTEGTKSSKTKKKVPAILGQGYLHVQSRLRVTRDGGHSILAVPDPTTTTRLGRSSGGPAAPPKVAGAPASAGPAPAGAVAPAGPSSGKGGAASKSAKANVKPSSPSNNEVPASVPPAVRAEGTPSDGALDSAMQVILDYVRGQRARGARKLSVKTVRKYFSSTSTLEVLPPTTVDDIVRRAAKAGLIVLEKGEKAERLNLSAPPPAEAPSATKPAKPPLPVSTNAAVAGAAAAAITSTILLKGPAIRFAPLMKYVVSSQEASGSAGLELSAIHRHFLQTHPETYGKKLSCFRTLLTDAVTQGVLISAEGAPGTKSFKRIALVPGAKYVV